MKSGLFHWHSHRWLRGNKLLIYFWCSAERCTLHFSTSCPFVLPPGRVVPAEPQDQGQGALVKRNIKVRSCISSKTTLLGPFWCLQMLVCAEWKINYSLNLITGCVNNCSQALAMTDGEFHEAAAEFQPTQNYFTSPTLEGCWAWTASPRSQKRHLSCFEPWINTFAGGCARLVQVNVLLHDQRGQGQGHGGCSPSGVSAFSVSTDCLWLMHKKKNNNKRVETFFTSGFSWTCRSLWSQSSWVFDSPVLLIGGSHRRDRGLKTVSS